MLDKQFLYDWFTHDTLGSYLIIQEQDFIQTALSKYRPYRTLWLGDLSTHIAQKMQPENSITQSEYLPAEIIASAQTLPWRSNTFDCIITAHLPETEPQLTQILAELYRITTPQGHLLLTSFNPYSLWRFWRTAQLPNVSKSLSLSHIQQHAQSAQWQIEKVKFINHLPPFRQPENWQLIEYAGEYLWTQGATIHGIVLAKQVAQITPTTQTQTNIDFDDLNALSIARLNNQ
ncbi:class I SAM-dependent methyltransferase [Kingella negevensis]|uniref:Methyltransferase domain protein n=1 Tax=Kingella negevensis TaxID=1522312 RepID=A0A238TCK6_9NEIS|nr:methyltransferase domain-containing protein [Kingella negevensis]MDK4679909.1 methyltransferase domain-containing protein [Kingella negevensis]MDK4682372.1 methyltransferase domain-containing protein [Kingella negevensis]MDK4685306.1 methyltransferase domain-containing protein [Kingella negevensis]MDK4688944.1 methyltransferase domain-containing protein [Kingella negevensis]MDK4690569.1 methyltransferase domain-containing protein [Kingella negevensis]